MAYQDIEIEIKLPLSNPDEVKSFLEAHAVSQAREVYQKDSYFVPAHRDFLGVQYPYEWLRIRETATKASINYKHFHPENSEVTTHCDEYETKVEDPEAVKKIFKALDIKPVVIVEKTRSTWLLDDVEVAIDDVKKLGSYIELEATLPYPTPEAGKAYLHSILKKLGAQTGTEDMRGYPYLVLAKQKSN